MYRQIGIRLICKFHCKNWLRMLQYKLAHFNPLRAFPLTQLKQVPRNHRGLALLARRGSLRLVYKRRSLCSRNKAGLAHLTNRRSLRSRNMLAPNMRAGVVPTPTHCSDQTSICCAVFDHLRRRPRARPTRTTVRQGLLLGVTKL